MKIGSMVSLSRIRSRIEIKFISISYSVTYTSIFQMYMELRKRENRGERERILHIFEAFKNFIKRNYRKRKSLCGHFIHKMIYVNNLKTK